MNSYAYFLAVLMFPGLVLGQSVDGGLLPTPYISQATYDGVVGRHDFDEVRRHWEASGYTLVVQGAELIRTQQALDVCRAANEPLPDAPPCDVFTDFKDGPGGALWKPVSDSTGRVAFLLPHEYGSASNIKVYSDNGGVVATARFRSFGNPDRAQFDVSKTAAELAKVQPILVSLDINGRTECYVVLEPLERMD